jgi:hypothetical protein
MKAKWLHAYSMQLLVEAVTAASKKLLHHTVSCLILLQIPTKIEVFVGPAGPAAAPDADPAAVAAAVSNLRRLGYLSFDSNERSNHQARELKSVHVSVEAQLVRLLIHRCHVNKLNIYNQVGGASKLDILTLLPLQFCLFML